VQSSPRQNDAIDPKLTPRINPNSRGELITLILHLPGLMPSRSKQTALTKLKLPPNSLGDTTGISNAMGFYAAN
jgi:hypothetical protein